MSTYSCADAESDTCSYRGIRQVPPQEADCHRYAWATPLSGELSCCLQKKEKGRQTVLTMSSAASIMSVASAASRNLEAPFGYSDGVMLAYKSSKSAVTQSAALSS